MRALLHADDVIDRFVDRAVHLDQKVDRARFVILETLHQTLEQRTLRLGVEIGDEIVLESLIILERDRLSVIFNEEIERVDNRHLGDQIDLDFELTHLLREDNARLPIAVRVLLPIDEVVFRLNLERVIGHWRARVHCRAQADDLWADLDRARIAIMSQVIESGAYHARE